MEGRALFVTLDCLDCHSGQGLTDSAPGRLHDVGTLAPTSGLRLGGPLTGLDTPTLRGLWATAPYLHDGSAATLYDVLENPRHGDASNLPAEDKDKLVQFLLQLEGEDLDLERPAAESCACRAARTEGDARSAAGALLGLLVAALRRGRRARCIRGDTRARLPVSSRHGSERDPEHRSR